MTVLAAPNIAMVSRNIVFGIGSQGLLLVLSLIATRFVFRDLGGEALGIISFSAVLTFLFIAFSDMGLSLLITREVAAHRNSNNAYVEELVGTGVAVSWVAYLVSCALVVGLASWLVDHWLQVDVANRASATLALRLISASLLLAIPRAVYGAVLSGYERVDLLNIATLGSTAIQQSGLVIVLSAGGELFHASVWFGISAALGLLPFLYFVHHVGGIGLLLPAWNADVFVRNFRFASHLFTNALSGFLVTQMDKWMVSKFLSVSLLGYYGFIQGLVSKGAIVPGAIANAIFPSFSSGNVTALDRHSDAYYRKLQDFTCYVYLPVSAAAAMLGIVVIRLVFNEEVADLTWRALLLLSLGQYVMGILTVPYWLAVAMKRPDISFRSNLWALVLVVPTIITVTYRYGLIGAAGSSMLFGLWQWLYFMPRFCAQCLGASASPWCLQAGIFFAVGLAAYGLPWMLFMAMGQGLETHSLIIAYIFGTVIFIWSGWYVIGVELKDLIRRQVRSLMAVMPV